MKDGKIVLAALCETPIFDSPLVMATIDPFERIGSLPPIGSVAAYDLASFALASLHAWPPKRLNFNRLMESGQAAISALGAAFSGLTAFFEPC